MKRLLIILTTALASLTAIAQATPDKLSAEFNKKCPMEYADGMTLESVEYTDGGFVFNYAMGDDMFANFKSLGEILHDSSLAELMSSPDKGIQQMMAMCIDRGLGIKLVYHDTANNIFTIYLSPDDLK